MASDTPLDEMRRLGALRASGLLDTPAEERFDRVTRMAQRLFDVPIGLTSLVDEDRQWFKSRQGMEARETPRAFSFCAHAIGGDAVFQVADAEADARFAANPLVVVTPTSGFTQAARSPLPTGRNWARSASSTITPGVCPRSTYGPSKTWPRWWRPRLRRPTPPSPTN